MLPGPRRRTVKRSRPPSNKVPCCTRCARRPHWRGSTNRKAAQEADAVLRPIYKRFTEGFDYPDLVRARAVLERVE